MTEKVSELIGKPLITRGGEHIGYVKNVQTDKALRQIKNLECCDEEEEEFCLPLSAASELGKDAIVIRSPTAKPCKNCLPAPFGMTVFSVSGEELGKLCDLALRDGQIVQLLLSGGQAVDSERLVGLTDTAIVDLSDPFVPKTITRSRGTRKAKNTNIAATKPTMQPTADDEEAFASPAEPLPTDPSDQQATIHPVADSEEVRRRTKRAGSTMLTGKVLPQDLKDARGNILAKTGTVVSPHVIKSAMQHGKLFELTLLCNGTYPQF